MGSNKENEKKLYSLMGKRITELRKNAGYTSQETFAYDADIPRALYGRYEQGANLTINSLYRILKHHKITFEEFFNDGFKDLKF
jgi:transcriptional regulator with XRE-family HTH domain